MSSLSLSSVKTSKLFSPLLLGVFALFIMGWDFYLGGLRIFEMLGLGILLLGLLAYPKVQLENTPKGTLLLLIILGYWLFGLLNSLDFFFQAPKLSIEGFPDDTLGKRLKYIGGALLSIFTFGFFYFFPLNQRQLARLLQGLILFHSLFLFLQWLLYQKTGYLLHPNPINEVRFFSAIFRPGGFYLEPATFCFTMMALLFLKNRLLPFGWVDALGLVACVATLSFWGLGMVVLFGGYCLLFRSGWKGPILLSFLLLTGLLARPFLKNRYGEAWQETAFQVAIVERIAPILSGEDGSTQVRFANNWARGWTWDLHTLIGHGINGEAYDTDGIYYRLFYIYGILGCLLLGFALWLAWPRQELVYLMFCSALMLTASGALSSQLVYWAWLGLFFRPFERHRPA
jgi:hypothetical protein